MMTPSSLLYHGATRWCCLGMVAWMAGLTISAAGVIELEGAELRPLASSGHPQFAAHRFVLEDGSVLAYYTRPGNPTLMMVPGTGKDRWAFFDSGVVDRLVPTLGVVVVEMRGRGQSWPPPGPAKARVEQYASDVLALVRRLELTAWFMSGHSLGGMITLEIAGRNPPGLRGAILLEGWVHHSVAADAFGEDVLPSGQPYSLAKPKDMPPGWTEEQETALLRMWRLWTGGERAIRQVACPVLAVVGDRNRSPRPSQNVLKFPERPNIELCWVRGAGHNVLDPVFGAEVAIAANRFITQVESQAAPAK